MLRWALALTLAALTGCAAEPVLPAPQLGGAMPPRPAPYPPGQGPQAPQGFGPGAAIPIAAERAAPDGDIEDEPGVASPPAAPTSPLLSLSDAEIDQRFHHDLASIGSASVGRPNAGVLVNGVQ